MNKTQPTINSILVLISANAEWQAIRQLYANNQTHVTPYGKWFQAEVGSHTPIFLHGGWGKIAAAGSTQYAIDRWHPQLLVNLGTCGGFEGQINRSEIILVDKTIVYDIIEQMDDPEAVIAHYQTELDLSWLKEPYPQPVRRTHMVSADRDLLAIQIPELISRYHAVAGDWESGAIAYVAKRNAVRLLILRGVTDLVGPSGGEAYGNKALFERMTLKIMQRLIDALPGWLEAAGMTGTNQ